MSQPASARPPRSASGMVGALVVLVLIVVGWVWFRNLTSADEPTAPAVKAVDWQAWVKAGRADKELSIFAPDELPSGWKATSVEYAGGVGGHWHLGMLTGQGKYVGIEESRATTDDLVQEYVDEDAVRGKDVEIDGAAWQSWTDAGGDYALVRSISLRGKPYESVLVGGSAPAATIRAFAGGLTAGEVKAPES